MQPGDTALGDQLDAAPATIPSVAIGDYEGQPRVIARVVATLPPTCTKVAWLDADILFERPDWAILTSRLLDRFTIVQVFEQVIRLPRHHTEYRGDGEVIGGFAHSYSHRKEIHLGGHYHEHGHTGFG